MKKLVFLVLLCLLPCQLRAQVQTDGNRQGRAKPAEGTIAAPIDSAKKFERVIPFEIGTGIYQPSLMNDSLKRWQQWMNPMEWYNRRPGFITSRLNGLGRNDAMIAHGVLPQFQSHFVDGIRMNDPITGFMNSNRIPHHRIDSYVEDRGAFGTEHHWNTTYFYVVEPLTQFDLDQAGLTYRSLSGILTQNITQKTNVELGYWGKSDDIVYSSGQTSARQAYSKVRHHLNDTWLLQANWHYDGIQLQESYGYQVFDLRSFEFNPFVAESRVGGLFNEARSSLRTATLSVGLYQRADTNSVSDNAYRIYYSSNRRFYKGMESSFLNLANQTITIPSDSTFVESVRYGANATHHLRLGPLGLLQVQGTAEYIGLSDDTTGMKGIRNVGFTELGARYFSSSTNPTKSLLSAGLYSSARTDGHAGGHSFVTLSASDKANRFHAYAKLSAASIMPTLQQKYWHSNGMFGNEELNNVNVARADAGVRVNLWYGLHVQAELFTSHMTNAIGIESITDTTRQFQHITGLSMNGGSVQVRFENEHWEVEASSTIFHQHADGTSNKATYASFLPYRIWNKGSVYWKGYVLNRAAYVKAGAFGMFSPMVYRSMEYNPVLDYWDFWGQEPDITRFYRVDLDLSARVRTVIFLMRIENVLDRLGQLGYFETAPYPMRERRFRLGLRVIFRN